MFKFLKRLTIKDYRNTADDKVRVRYGIVAGAFGLISNTLLCAAKLTVGLIGNSLTIVADAVNNLSDAGASAATLIGFRLSARPADREHPYGHARYEYLTGLIIALLVLSAGVLLGKSSIEKIITPKPMSVSAVTYAVLCAAVVVKIIQALLYADFGKSISSTALKAGAADSRNDVIITLVVLASAIIADTTDVNPDGVFGLIVSIAIVLSALKLIKETFDPLLGEAPDKALTERIKQKIRSYPGVLGVHDLMIHSYGVNRLFATAHVEIAADTDIRVGHELMDTIEREIANEEHISLLVHMDPVETDDPTVYRLQALVTETLAALDERLSIHDFRVVNSLAHTAIRFDAVLPYESKLTVNDLTAALSLKFQTEQGTFLFQINVDHI